jgi:multiple sugar transport system ATP-binding protein
MARLELTGLLRRFGAVAALRDVSLSCERGELVVVFGPPGSGKSTLLKVIAGLESIDAGQVAIEGRPQDAVPTHRRDVAMAFESYALYPHFTVRRNLEFPLRAPGRRVPAETRQRLVSEVGELLAIPHLMNRYPRQLSGGQRQRVSLGRAIIRPALVTLLDEPLAHLDAQLRSALRGELKVFLKSRGATTVYATPDFQEGFGIADRVVVLIEGTVHQIGTPEEIFARPADSRVARLAGDPAMNLLPVDGDGLLGLTPQRKVTPPWIGGVRGLPPLGLVGGRPAAVVRPRRARGESRVGTATVLLIERVGSSAVVELDVGGAGLTAKLPLDAVDFAIGDVVSVDFRWDAAHFFGADTRRMDPAPFIATLTAA